VLLKHKRKLERHGEISMGLISPSFFQLSRAFILNGENTFSSENPATGPHQAFSMVSQCTYRSTVENIICHFEYNSNSLLPK
jgi:hypothetical protein